jgi:hypothetical protein
MEETFEIQVGVAIGHARDEISHEPFFGSELLGSYELLKVQWEQVRALAEDLEQFVDYVAPFGF